MCSHRQRAGADSRGVFLADGPTLGGQLTAFSGSQLTVSCSAGSVAVNQDAAAMASAAEVESDEVHDAGLLSWLTGVSVSRPMRRGAIHPDDPQLPSRDDGTGTAGADGDAPRRRLDGHAMSELERIGLAHGRGSG